jgi:hypothetical protein
MALCAPQPSHATAPRRYKPGITLTGQMTNVLLDTKYTYKVQVVTAKSYRHAVVILQVAPSVCLFRNVVNLVAYRPWKGHYTLEYRTTNNMAQGLVASVFTPSSKRGSHLIFGKAYKVTPVPNQEWHPVPGAPCPQPLFGS